MELKEWILPEESRNIVIKRVANDRVHDVEQQNR